MVHRRALRTRERKFSFSKPLVSSSRLGIVADVFRKQSQKYHLENPYWKTFDPYVVPLLDKEMDLRRFHELDTSKPVKVE